MVTYPNGIVVSNAQTITIDNPTLINGSVGTQAVPKVFAALATTSIPPQSVEVIAPAPIATGFYFVNQSNVTLYVAINSLATANSFPVNPGQVYTCPTTPAPNQSASVYNASTTVTATIYGERY